MKNQKAYLSECKANTRVENYSTLYDASDNSDELALCGVVYELGRPDSTTISLCKRCDGCYDRCIRNLDGRREQKSLTNEIR